MEWRDRIVIDPEILVGKPGYKANSTGCRIHCGVIGPGLVRGRDFAKLSGSNQRGYIGLSELCK
jgi:hypothetical protein